MTTPSIFISHATLDDEEVNRLAEKLETAGITVWVDHRYGIVPGDIWGQEIHDAVHGCSAGLFVMSPRSAKSLYCMAEWTRILALGKKLYIALVDDVLIGDTPLRLGIIQYANLRKNYDQGAQELIDAILNKRELNPESDVIGQARRITGQFPHSQLDLPLIGRDEDLRQMSNMLSSDGRVTMVLGIGGIGKTRLAAEIAVTVNESTFPGGVIWHEIQPYTTPEKLTADIRSHFQMAITTEEFEVWSMLARRGALLVLDNAESCRVVEDYTALLNRLELSGGTRVLITSRYDWNEIFNRQRHSLGAVTPEAALEILGKMTVQHRSKISLNGREVEMVQAARRHPRLMQYALSWTDHYPVERVLTILKELKGRNAEKALEELVGRTIEQVKSLIHGPEAIASLRRLAVCRGSFTFAAAEALIEDTDSLSLLISWNLVQVVGERYFIDPLIVATAGEDESAHLVHYNYYFELANVLNEQQHYFQLDADTANLESAFEWALKAKDRVAVFKIFRASHQFLRNRQRYKQRMDWMLQLESLFRGHPDAEQYPFVQYIVGLIYQNHPLGSRRENLQMAIKVYTEVLKFYDPNILPLEYAEVQTSLGIAYRYLAQIEDELRNLQNAIQSHQNALQFLSPTNSRLKYAAAQNNLGNAYRALAEISEPELSLQRAIEAYQEALRYRTSSTVPLDYASTQNNLGVAFRSLSNIKDRMLNLRRAIEAYQEALRYRTPETAPLGYATSQHNLGFVYRIFYLLSGDKGNLQSSIQAYQEALRFRTVENSPFYYSMTMWNLGFTYKELGEPAQSIQCWREAARVAMLVGNEDGARKYTKAADKAEAKLRQQK